MLVQQGFWYHHAEPNYLMLVYWIPEVEHTLPANATHRVGIGAFVMNEKREVFPCNVSLECHPLFITGFALLFDILLII